MIELDIRKSRDNFLYVMHDRLIGRTADRNIDIERANSEEIAGLKLKNGEPVPTLSDAMNAVAGMAGLNLELKSSGSGLPTAELLVSSGYTGYVLVSSFKEQEIQAVRRVMPQLPTSLIFDVFAVRDVPWYSRKGHSIISLRKGTVNEKLVEACHEHGIRVYVWTVDEEAEMRKLFAWGVDGIYTNRPGALKELLIKFQNSSAK
jgi:glycerophosphoryl diester phosphodiesterase